MTSVTHANDIEFTSAAASRMLLNGESCFVGIGTPSVAALTAKHTHAPDLALIYESGAYGTVGASVTRSFSIHVYGGKFGTSSPK